MKKKMLISIALIAIMLLNCIAPILKVAADTDSRITFEKNMYAALKEELQKQNITAIYNDAQRTIIINDEELAKVTSLSLGNKGLTNLTGLEMFTNLKELDLSSNELNKDSNLEVLNSFTLTTLDLSSNEIEDLSMVTNIKEIPTLYLHNQKFDVVEVVSVDTTEKSDQYDGTIYPLPRILTDFVDYIPSEWLKEENYSNNGIKVENCSPTTVPPAGVPYIYWHQFDHENLKVVYSDKVDKDGNVIDGYTIRKGMVKVTIKVTDSKSKLYNSDITLYYVTADSEERGIHIKDKNMYTAIRDQLTAGQDENKDLISHKDTEPATQIRNLYERYFDDAQTLVISIDDIINKIPSLKLSNKRIKDLSGIEHFVGLETELDVSGNYIKSIDPLIALEENQEKEEALLRERVQAQISLISDTVNELENVRKEIESLEESRSSKNQEYIKAQGELIIKQEEYDKIDPTATDDETKNNRRIRYRISHNVIIGFHQSAS